MIRPATREAPMTEPNTSASSEWPDEDVEIDPNKDEQSVETPLEDAAEQARDAVHEHSDAVRAQPVPLDVDPADLAEQAREVPHDEDEYR
jgi:hypothetical protein